MCIISHKYKFIFIRVRKTASTSMQILLSNLCGPFDIITSLKDKDLTKPFRDKNNWNYIQSKKPVFYNHIPAFKVKEMICYQDKRIWNEYFKFCFERNPWDKALSVYYWNTEQRSTYTNMSLDKFINYLEKFSDWKLFVAGSSSNSVCYSFMVII